MPPLLRGLTYITWCGNYGRACFVCHLVQTCEVVSFAACMPACDERASLITAIFLPAFAILQSAWLLAVNSVVLALACLKFVSSLACQSMFYLFGSFLLHQCVWKWNCAFASRPRMFMHVPVPEDKTKGGILRSRGEIVRGDSG